MKRTNRRNNARNAAALAGLVGAAMMTGCLSYSNYPQEDGRTWINARDTASIREPMAKALAFVIEKDLASQTNIQLPATGPIVAINLPGGIAPDSYRWVASNSHSQAVPHSESNSGLPIYHIGRVSIRHSEVRVDVIRPIDGMEQGIDNPVYVGVEVWMTGATGARQITSDRPREVGTLTVPALFTIEDIERAFYPEPEVEAEPEAVQEEPTETGG